MKNGRNFKDLRDTVKSYHVAHRLTKKAEEKTLRTLLINFEQESRCKDQQPEVMKEEDRTGKSF